MPPHSPPRRPSLVLTTPASPPCSITTTTSNSLRNSSSSTQLRPHYSPSPAQSRSPSPTPSSSSRRRSDASRLSSPVEAVPSATAALAQAGLGLLSLPPSPVHDQVAFLTEDEEQEELSEAIQTTGETDAEAGNPSSQRKRTTSLGFLEPDKELKERERGRTRKKSFTLGLGGPDGRMRRISFGGSSAVDKPSVNDSSSPSSQLAPPVPSAPTQPTPTPRKTSGPKALLRRARSFGTSPILGGSGSGVFPSSSSQSTVSTPLTVPSPASTAPPSPTLPPVPPVLSRLSTSSHSLSGPSLTPSPSTSAPITPNSASPSPSLSLFHHSSPTFTSSPFRLRQPSLSRQPEEQEMVLAEPVPSPHWLFAAAPGPIAGQTHGNGTVGDREKGKDKGRQSEEREMGSQLPEQGSAPPVGGGPRRKSSSAIKRATLSVFGWKDTSGSNASNASSGSVEQQQRSSGEATLPMPPTTAIYDSPTGSPDLSKDPGGAWSARTSRENSSSSAGGVGGEGGGGGMPSLPSLPSLQLSNNPYRMSWAFGSPSSGSRSPANSPSKSRSPAPSAAGAATAPREVAAPLMQSRPSLTISPSPSISASVSFSSLPSPISPATAAPSPAPTSASQTLPLPPLHHTPSTDSAQTLHIALPPRPSTSTASISPHGTIHRLARAHSTSSPPPMRRANSYAPPTPPASTSSPLATPNLHPSLADPSPTPLDRRVTLTRAARSYSDASDRRTPSASTPQALSSSAATSPSGGFVYGGGRNAVTGGLGVPPGGGYFSLPRAGAGGGAAKRPGTADSRTSVFGLGGWGSLFGSSSSSSAAGAGGGPAGSVGMSRSSSAATSASAGTPGGGEVSEFGALFDGGGGGKGSRPGTGRKRGLSVGAGLFGGGGGAAGREREKERKEAEKQSSVGGRARSGSGSGSSVASDGAMRSSSVLGRMRASTDPSKRFSLGSASASTSASVGPQSPFALNASLAPPAVSSRPGTADGALSFGKRPLDGRRRGSSLSVVTHSSSLPPSPAPQQQARFREEPKAEKKYPKPRVAEGETPQEYVRRLMEGEGDDGEGKVGKGEVTRVLAASADPFHAAALAAYLRLFPFASLALDIALRLFLCSASLPTETQQIDRVMEAFARRWCECNPEVFAPKQGKGERGAEGKGEGEESDIPYVLAFSMVMLSTDQFNPNAKSKMTKADYVKNTRIDGVAPEILEYLYDQITLAPFVFVDDDDPASAFFNPASSLSSSFSPEKSELGSSSIHSGSLGASNVPTAAGAGGSSFFGGGKERGKIDPYHLIATGQLRRFRVDVESHIPFKSPFSYTGTSAFLNATSLHSLFARAPILQITTRPRSSSKSQPSAQPSSLSQPPLPATGIGTPISPFLEGSPLTPTVSSGTFVINPPRTKDRAVVSSLKITKIGMLSRKEDLAEGGKKAASRKWKAWSVVLTGSQLLFFKDSHFAHSLQHTLDAAAAASQPRPDDSHVLVFTLQSPFKPDAVLSLANTAAIYDSTYKRHPNVFRLVAPAGRQYLFQAHDADDLNSWLHAINYAASFKTANVRIRTLQPSTLRSSAASSPIPSSPSLPPSFAVSYHSPPQMAWGNTLGSLASTASTSGSISRKSSTGPSLGDDTVVLESGDASETFAADVQDDKSLPVELREALAIGSVKAETGDQLAVEGRQMPSEERPLPSTPTGSSSFASSMGAPPSSISTRADTLRTRINDLDAEIRQARDAVQTDLRLAKHLAILTPFRSSTREKVLTAIPPIEKRVRQARMNLVKLICYREVLSRDLLVEDRETERLIRKHSHHRSHSRRTSSIPRQRSPPPHHHSHPHHAPRNVHSHATISAHWSSPLSRSNSSLAPPRMFPSDGNTTDYTTRDSFESATESLSGLDAGHSYSLTDDELDRLQLRSPPQMQRSKTEQDWATAMEHLSRAPAESVAHTDDELELLPPVGGTGRAGTPIKARNGSSSTDALSPTPSTLSLV
ncbi:hypothetical protein JCM5296_005413 [Sporobolomyces johnsonii]